MRERAGECARGASRKSARDCPQKQRNLHRTDFVGPRGLREGARAGGVSVRVLYVEGVDIFFSGCRGKRDLVGVSIFD